MIIHNYYIFVVHTSQKVCYIHNKYDRLIYYRHYMIIIISLKTLQGDIQNFPNFTQIVPFLFVLLR